MPHHFNSCVPGCTRNFRNSPKLQYYRIPKCEKLRKTYKILLRNETLKLDSSQTRICSEHFEGGEKLSRHHLPSIFPWSKQSKPRREIIKHDDVRIKKRREESYVLIPREIEQINKTDTVVLDTMDTTQSETVTDTAMLEESVHNVDKEDGTDQTDQTRKTMNQSFVTAKSQTDMDGKTLEEIPKELNVLREENQQLREKSNELMEKNRQLNIALTKSAVFDIEKYKENPDDIAFYTGLPDYAMLMLCYDMIKDSAKNISYNHNRVYCDLNSKNQPGRPRVLNTFQEFVMVMMRIRLGLFERDLAHRFNVSIMTVSRITRLWTRFLRSEFEPLIQIPPSDVLKLHMPNVFKKLCPETVIIVDCTEFQMERPSALDAQSACYSSYKSSNTVKALLGITPSGVVSFVSELFPGSTSDREITVQSGLLDRLKKGDGVMADKGFNCKDELASVGASLVTPNFLKAKKQFSTAETEQNKTIASLRVHVERLMARLKNWHIFDHKIPISMASIASDI